MEKDANRRTSPAARLSEEDRLALSAAGFDCEAGESFPVGEADSWKPNHPHKTWGPLNSVGQNRFWRK